MCSLQWVLNYGSPKRKSQLCEHAAGRSPLESAGVFLKSTGQQYSESCTLHGIITLKWSLPVSNTLLYTLKCQLTLITEHLPVGMCSCRQLWFYVWGFQIVFYGAHRTGNITLLTVCTACTFVQTACACVIHSGGATLLWRQRRVCLSVTSVVVGWDRCRHYKSFAHVFDEAVITPALLLFPYNITSPPLSEQLSPLCPPR